MSTTRALRRYLLLTLATAWACADREPVHPHPPDENEDLRPKNSGQDRRFATPPDENGNQTCKYELEQYCFAPGELQKILKGCTAQKSDDGDGCLSLASYKACSSSIVSGP